MLYSYYIHFIFVFSRHSLLNQGINEYINISMYSYFNILGNIEIL